MAGRGLVDATGGLSLTAEGWDWLGTLGIDVPAVRTARRPVVRTCLDWTERRPHLAGAAGAALLGAMLERGWVTPTRHDGGPGRGGRAVQVTPVGAAGLERDLGLVLSD